MHVGTHCPPLTVPAHAVTTPCDTAAGGAAHGFGKHDALPLHDPRKHKKPPEAVYPGWHCGRHVTPVPVPAHTLASPFTTVPEGVVGHTSFAFTPEMLDASTAVVACTVVDSDAIIVFDADNDSVVKFARLLIAEESDVYPA